MGKQTVTAFYDSREYANNAVLMLRQAGVPIPDVTLSPETAAADYGAAGRPPAKGFWASLEELFGGSDDHATYTEGLRRGGIMLTAHVDDAQVDDAVRILEQHGSVDLDERETTWRSEGWTGGSAITGGGVANEGAGPLRSMTPVAETGTARVATGAGVAAPAGLRPAVEPTGEGWAGGSPITGGGIANEGAGPLRSMTPIAETEVTRVATEAAVVSAPAPPPAITLAGDSLRDDVIQVAEETLKVGKRAVSRGTVRIHAFVVERPVTETVTLRDETVTVDRRPLDRPVAAADLGPDAFTDRTIEMEEIDEEAVVAKTTRVVEEISLRKAVTDSVETVTDTVRRTKVDVEDGRTDGSAAAPFAEGGMVQRAKDMDVVGSDGQPVGVVDHVDGTSIKLKRMDPASGGSHHLIPTDWVQSIDQKVRLRVTAADARSRWTTV